jgi:hypothetical protein
MAYNRENILRRIIDVQNIVMEHKKHDTPQTKIYRKYIYPVYRISYSTFNWYLSVPAKAQLEKLLEKKERIQELKDRQLNLFD